MRIIFVLSFIYLFTSCDSKRQQEPSPADFSDKTKLKLLENFKNINDSFFLYYSKDDADFGKLLLMDQNNNNILDSISLKDSRAFQVIKTDSLEFELHYEWRSSIIHAESVILYKVDQARLVPLIDYTKSYYTKSIDYVNSTEIKIDFSEEISSCETFIRQSQYCGKENAELFTSKVKLRYDSLNTLILSDTIVERTCLNIDPIYGVFMERYLEPNEIKMNGLNSNNVQVPYSRGMFFNGIQWEYMK